MSSRRASRGLESGVIISENSDWNFDTSAAPVLAGGLRGRRIAALYLFVSALFIYPNRTEIMVAWLTVKGKVNGTEHTRRVHELLQRERGVSQKFDYHGPKLHLGTCDDQRTSIYGTLDHRPLHTPINRSVVGLNANAK